MWTRALATPLRVVMHRDVGYRQMHPGRLLFAAVLVMIVLPHTINALFYRWPPSALNTPVLAVFAGIIVVLGLRHRFLHGQALAQGGSDVHGMDIGVPRLWTLLPFLPLAFVACVLEPLACFLVGYVATFICAPFGWALWLSGASLAIADGRAYLGEREKFLDAADSIVDAQRHASRAGHHNQRPQQRRPRPQAAGTPTGAADDLDWHFARRND